jgi:hypothetical protein
MNYLKVWTNFRDVVSSLTDAEVGRLFMAMLTYAETGEEPENFEGNERFLWAVAKRDIDMTNARNETFRQNGSKGGRPKTKQNQEKPNETKNNQEKPNETNENQTEPNETLKEKKRKEKKGNENNSRFTPPTIDEVIAYCQERKNNVNPVRWFNFYASKGWKVGKEPMKDWKASVRYWESDENDGNNSRGNGNTTESGRADYSFLPSYDVV